MLTTKILVIIIVAIEICSNSAIAIVVYINMIILHYLNISLTKYVYSNLLLMS